MEEFTKVYKHLYEALGKFNVPLELIPDKLSKEQVEKLFPVFRMIDAQVDRDTVDDHVFLFSPLITEENFFKLTENNRKILLVYVKKLYEIQKTMDLDEPDLNSQVSDMLSLFDTTDIDATDEDIEQAASTLGETMGLDENDPMRQVMHDIIHNVGNGLKSGKSVQDLIQDATLSFRGRITDDLKSGNVTPEQIQASQAKMMERMEKLMRNPMAAASMMKSEDTKKKEKEERRKAMRKKWRNKK
jgi:hypothetical protein